MLLFEDLHGFPAPRLREGFDGRLREPDGERLFDLKGAASHWQRDPEELRRFYLSIVDDFIGTAINRDGGKRADFGVSRLTNAQGMRLLWRMEFQHLTENEFEAARVRCEARGLNIATRHVWIEKRHKAGGKSEVVIITTIDGLRAIAERTGCYAGGPEPEFEYGPEDAIVPLKATATVNKLVNGKSHPVKAVVYWDEAVQFAMDAKECRAKPHFYLGKWAEAAALRKAFPEQLAGVYERAELWRETATGEGSAESNGEPHSGAGEEEPMSQIQFELALVDLGYGVPEKRSEVVERFRKTYPALAKGNQQAFYRRVLAELKKDQPAMAG